MKKDNSGFSAFKDKKSAFKDKKVSKKTIFKKCVQHLKMGIQNLKTPNWKRLKKRILNIFQPKNV